MEALTASAKSLFDDAQERVKTLSSGKALLDEGGAPMRTKVSVKANAKAALAARAMAVAQLRDVKKQLLDVGDAMKLASDDQNIRKCMLSDEIIEFGLLATAFETYSQTIDDALRSLETDVPRPPTTSPSEDDAALIVSMRGLADITDPVKHAQAIGAKANADFDKTIALAAKNHKKKKFNPIKKMASLRPPVASSSS